MNYSPNKHIMILILLIVGFLFMSFCPTLCMSQIESELPKVMVFEFDLYSNPVKSDPAEDQFWKKRFQDEIMSQLKNAKFQGEINSYGFLEKQYVLREIQNMPKYCADSGVRYVIDGTIIGLKKDVIEVEINLYDHTTIRQGPKITIKRFLRRDLEVLTYWSQKTFRDICNVIAGKLPKEVIFSYCFYLDDPTLDDSIREKYQNKIVRLAIPMSLAYKLEEKLKEKFIFPSFNSREIMAKECNQQLEVKDYGFTPQASDYILRGYLQLDENDGDTYNVSVELYEMGTVNRAEKLIDGFDIKYTETFFEFLADKIKHKLDQK